MRPRWWIEIQGPVFLAVLLVAGGLTAAAAGAAKGGKDKGGEPAEAAAPDNLQKRIQTVETGIEIELRSSRPFPVRALPPVLRIGERDFWQSRNPADGRLDTLIFVVPREAFTELTDGDPMTVFYAVGTTAGTVTGAPAAAVPERAGYVWSFGGLRKELLDLEPAGENEAEE